MKSPLIFLLLWFCLGAPTARGQDLGQVGQARPVQLHSGLSLVATTYRADGLAPRQAESSYFLTGSPVLEVYGISLPFTFTLSNQHRSFQQPFNQFGVTPFYKWAKLYLGYNSMHLSPFTLSGQRFLGVGTELTPGKLRLAAVRGRFQKAIPLDTAISNIPGQYLLDRPVPAFERRGTGLKLGFGSRTSYLDLIYLKAKDDAGSIDPLPDSLFLDPQENAVAGLSSQLTLFKRLTWKLDVAASAFTRDLAADTLETDDFAAARWLRDVLLPRQSSQLTLAGETSLAYRSGGFGLKLQYRRIEPEYKSMGVFFFQRDVEQYTLNTNLGLRGQTIRFNGTIGWQRNNLLHNRLATTRRLIGSAGLEVQPSESFGVGIHYTNFGLSQALQGTGLADTLALRQVNQSLTVLPRLSLTGGAWRHQFNLVLNYNATTGMEAAYVSQPDNRTLMANLSYALQHTQKRTGVTGGLTWRRLQLSPTASTIHIGAQAGLQQPLLKERLLAGLNAGAYANRTNGVAAGNTFYGNLMLNYTLGERHSLFASLNYLRQGAAAGETGTAFSEWIGQSGINLNF